MKSEEFFDRFGHEEERSLEAGELLLGQGQDNETLFLVRAGALGVSLEAQHGSLDLGTKGVNRWIGEMGLISPGNASATVVATTPARVTALDRSAYVRLRDAGDPAAGQLLSWIGCDLARRIRRSSAADYAFDGRGSATLVPQMQALHGIAREDVWVSWVPASAAGHATGGDDKEILQALEAAGAFTEQGAEDDRFSQALRADLAHLAPQMGLQQHQDGDVIIQEGQRADGIFVVLDGSIRVRAGSPDAWFHVDKTLGAGSTFGEIAFFDDGSRSATCTAAGPVRLAVIYPAAVKALLDGSERGSATGLHLVEWFVRQLVADARRLNTLILERLGA